MNEDALELLSRLDPVDESALPDAPPFSPFEPTRRHGRGRHLVVALVAALVVVPTAYAVGPRVYSDFFGRRGLAPLGQAVANWDQELRADAVGSMPPQADASAVTGVATLATAYGPVYLWRAPELSGNGECLLVQYGTLGDVSNLGSSCDSSVARSGLDVSTYYTAEHPLLVISGRAPGAAAVELRSDGSSTSAELVDGYFIVTAPKVDVDRQLVALDGAGAVIATRDVPPLPPVDARG